MLWAAVENICLNEAVILGHVLILSLTYLLTYFCTESLLADMSLLC